MPTSTPRPAPLAACLALAALLLAGCAGVSNSSNTTAPFDFTAGALTCSPAKPVAGQSVTITSTITNSGGYGAPAIPWQAVRDDNTVNAAVVDSGTIVRLYGGSSKTLSFTDGNPPLGIHTYTLKLDPSGSLGDARSNNTSTFSLTVANYNLSATLEVTPSGVADQATGPIVLTLIIHNNGPEAITPLTIPCRVTDTAGLFDSTNFTVTPSPNCSISGQTANSVDLNTNSSTIAPDGGTTSMFLIVTPIAPTKWSSSCTDNLTFAIDPLDTFLNASDTPSSDATFTVPGSG